MDGLRWVLLLFGAVVVIGVFLYSRRERAKPAKTPDSDPPDIESGADPLLDTLSDPLIEPAIERREPSFGDKADATDPDAAPPGDGEEATKPKIVTLRIIAGDKKPFAGDELILSLRGIGMRHGRFGIFHRYDGNDENRVIFSAASLVEPGSFDLENIKDQEIPGISLFMVLPGPVDGAEGFDLMMAAARTLTQSLGAELLDESGSTLSIQRERYLREEIIQFQHGILVA